MDEAATRTDPGAFPVAPGGMPAHGAVTDTVHARVGQLVTHHEDRLQEMLTVFETAAHLDLLVAQERMVREDSSDGSDGLTSYRT